MDIFLNRKVSNSYLILVERVVENISPLKKNMYVSVIEFKAGLANMLRTVKWLLRVIITTRLQLLIRNYCWY